MNKYKVGDKIVLTVSDVNEKAYYSYYVFNNNDLILWEPSTDKYAEPLSTYTEPLETKIENLKKKLKRWVEKCTNQSTEITRLLAENEKLKAENGNVIWEIEQAFDRGCNAAWELVRKIFDMETNDIEDIFIKEDAWNLGTVLNNYTYQEAAAKVEEWEKAKEEIKVGDEVEKNDLRDVRFIVTFTNGRLMNGVTQSGLVFANEKPKEWHKTGRHIDIDSFLKQIGEEQE